MALLQEVLQVPLFTTLKILPVMVFRNRSRNSIRPVHRIKHVIDNQRSLALGVQQSQILALSVDAPVLANATQVESGCTINGIYLHVKAYSTSSGALTNFYMMVFKNPGGNLTFPNANVVGSDDNKKYVIHQEMVMFQKVTPSNPRTIFNGVIVIPRGYRRMAINDTISVGILSPGSTSDVCIQAHYKEFR